MEGSQTPVPKEAASDNGYPCPIGNYCPAGSITEIPCEPGTFNDIVS